MSLENANQSSSDSPSENVPESHKNKKITYTREFLLSFSDLERCKKLPNGFDSSVLSELEDNSSSSVVERSRGKGGEYGSTLTRFDSSSNFSKGSSGRWDTRSTGSSDRDADSQSEHDTFGPERRYGNQYKRSWQGSSGGHDGLLGKPSGFVSGTSPNTRTSGTYQLKKTSEPYQPPRPFKPAPYSRSGIDSCNDETFGSTDDSTQDRAEEERKRRASFEMMRKEQHKERHKALQEKQNQRDKASKPSGDELLDLLQSSKRSQQVVSEKEEDLEGHVAPPSVLPLDASNKPSLSRPLVPPGFAGSSGGDRKILKGSSNASTESEMKNGATEAQYYSTTVGTEDIAMGTPNLTQAWDPFLNREDKEAGPIGTVASSSGQESSISILEKFFGSALSKPSAPSSSFVQIENQPSKAEEEIINPSSVPESSKFAHWFIEEDVKPVENSSSRDLLSLFAKNPNKEKSTQFPQTSLSTTNETEFEQVQPQTLALGSITPTNMPKSDLSTNTKPGILTCEDLEQLMLAQASTSIDNNGGSNGSPNISTQKWQVGGGSNGADVDNSASHQLLSLLQKGAPSPVAMKEKIPGITPGTNLEANPADSGNNVTLEALFGAAFMNELHSMDAPISSGREDPLEPQFPEFRNNNSNGILLPGYNEGERNINLPEEDCLFSVNDPLNFQPNPNSLVPFTNPRKSEVALHDASVGDLGNRMLNIGLGPDNTTPVSHLRGSDNVPLPHNINPNQRMRFLVPEGMLHDPSHQFRPQFDFDPSARHVMTPNARFAGVGFGPEMDPVRHGLTRVGPAPHPMRQVHPGFVSHDVTGVPNFAMHQQPNFGHGIGVGMPGPGPLEFGPRNQTHPEALERILQMEMRAKAQQAGRIPGFHGGPELGTDIRYR